MNRWTPEARYDDDIKTRVAGIDCQERHCGSHQQLLILQDIVPEHDSPTVKTKKSPNLTRVQHQPLLQGLGSCQVMLSGIDTVREGALDRCSHPPSQLYPP
jgi:hypothetical protein